MDFSRIALCVPRHNHIRPTDRLVPFSGLEPNCCHPREDERTPTLPFRWWGDERGTTPLFNAVDSLAGSLGGTQSHPISVILVHHQPAFFRFYPLSDNSLSKEHS